MIGSGSDPGRRPMTVSPSPKSGVVVPGQRSVGFPPLDCRGDGFRVSGDILDQRLCWDVAVLGDGVWGEHYGLGLVHQVGRSYGSM